MEKTRSVFTTEEAASLTGFHVETLRRAIRSGELKAAGQRPYRISRTELRRWWREEKEAGELDLPHEAVHEVRNPISRESAVEHAQKLAQGLRSLSALGKELALDLPDVEAMATQIEEAAERI